MKAQIVHKQNVPSFIPFDLVVKVETKEDAQNLLNLIGATHGGTFSKIYEIFAEECRIQKIHFQDEYEIKKP